MAKAEWAAWSQAVGSIAAIWGAFAISAHQLQTARTAEANRRVLATIDKIRGAQAILNTVRMPLLMLRGLFAYDSREAIVNIGTDQLEEVVERCSAALRAIPLHDFGNAAFAMAASNPKCNTTACKVVA